MKDLSQAEWKDEQKMSLFATHYSYGGSKLYLVKVFTRTLDKQSVYGRSFTKEHTQPLRRESVLTSLAAQDFGFNVKLHETEKAFDLLLGIADKNKVVNDTGFFWTEEQHNATRIKNVKINAPAEALI